MSDLDSSAQDLNIDLTYDAFGAGQARLPELPGIQLYAVMFDITLICDLDKLPHKRRALVGLRVKLVKQCPALALAEGVYGNVNPFRFSPPPATAGRAKNNSLPGHDR